MAEQGPPDKVADAADEKSVAMLASGIRSELRSLREDKKVQSEQQMKVNNQVFCF